MKILLVTADYPPEIRSVATMCKELAEELTLRGHQVTVLTSYESCNLPDGIIPKSFNTDAEENSVRVLRVKTMPLHKSNYWIRGLAQITLPFLFLRTLKKKVREKMDAVIIYSPPLSLARIGAALKKIHGPEVYVLFNVQDIFPQNAIDLGILKNKLIIRYFEQAEICVYRGADALTTCTEGGRQFLITHKGVDEKKVTAVYNWIDLEPYETAKPDGFRELYKLKKKFVILFAGIIGLSQGLEYIVEVARRLTAFPDIVFLFLGDGTSRFYLKELVNRYGLTNVRFGGFILPDKYPALLKEIDVGLMTLEKNCKTPTIPGKFFGFAAASLPVLAFLNPESEGHRVIKEAQCGYSMIPEDPEAGAQLVRRMYELRKTLSFLGNNGHDYVAKHFSKCISIDIIERLISKCNRCLKK